MRKTLHTIVTAAWLGLAGLFSPANASAQESQRHELKSDDLSLMHGGTLPGAIGRNAEKTVLEMAKYEVEKSPFRQVKKEFEKGYEELAERLEPGFGRVLLPQPDGTKKPECVVYLFFDDNKDGIFNMGTQVRPEAQEHGLFSIPNNVFAGMQNSPFLSACDEYVDRYKKLFEYKLFEVVGDDNKGIIQRANRIEKKKYTSEEWERMKQCVVETASWGIRNNKESLELIREGAKIMDEEFARWFSSLEHPRPHPDAELAVFKLASLPGVYTVLFIDKNKNGEPDTPEKALSVIKANQMITLYPDNCGFEPAPKIEAPKSAPFVPIPVVSVPAPKSEPDGEEEQKSDAGVPRGNYFSSARILFSSPTTMLTLEPFTANIPFGSWFSLGVEPRFGFDHYQTLRQLVISQGKDPLALDLSNSAAGKLSAAVLLTPTAELGDNLRLSLVGGAQYESMILGVGTITPGTSYPGWASYYLTFGGRAGIQLFDGTLGAFGEYLVHTGRNRGEEYNIHVGEESHSGTTLVPDTLFQQRMYGAIIYAHPSGFYAQVFRALEGLQVDTCELVSGCSGVEKHDAQGVVIGYYLQMFALSLAIEGKFDSRIIDQPIAPDDGNLENVLKYVNAPMIGAVITLHYPSKETDRIRALDLPRAE